MPLCVLLCARACVPCTCMRACVRVRGCVGAWVRACVSSSQEAGKSWSHTAFPAQNVSCERRLPLTTIHTPTKTPRNRRPCPNNGQHFLFKKQPHKSPRINAAPSELLHGSDLPIRHSNISNSGHPTGGHMVCTQAFNLRFSHFSLDL